MWNFWSAHLPELGTYLVATLAHLDINSEQCMCLLRTPHLEVDDLPHADVDAELEPESETDSDSENEPDSETEAETDSEPGSASPRPAGVTAS